MEDGIHVYDNPVGVLTSNPPFPIQLFQLNNYRMLSSCTPENTFSVGLEDLPRKGKKPNKKQRRLEKKLRGPDCKRINDRPKACEDRQEKGHWEMDCIESGRGDTSCLLTLVERYTRECLIFKIRRQTQDAVLRKINGLERKFGSKAFKEKFKSITVDNGSEFLNWKKLEQSVYEKGNRTEIYYAHAYASWNEEATKI